ncbi:hypothetical protein GW17_00024207, partial [Ensete ventricosum]
PHRCLLPLLSPLSIYEVLLLYRCHSPIDAVASHCSRIFLPPTTAHNPPLPTVASPPLSLSHNLPSHVDPYPIRDRRRCHLPPLLPVVTLVHPHLPPTAHVATPPTTSTISATPSFVTSTPATIFLCQLTVVVVGCHCVALNPRGRHFFPVLLLLPCFRSAGQHPTGPTHVFLLERYHHRPPLSLLSLFPSAAYAALLCHSVVAHSSIAAATSQQRNSRCRSLSHCFPAYRCPLLPLSLILQPLTVAVLLSFPSSLSTSTTTADRTIAAPLCHRCHRRCLLLQLLPFLPCRRRCFLANRSPPSATLVTMLPTAPPRFLFATGIDSNHCSHLPPSSTTPSTPSHSHHRCRCLPLYSVQHSLTLVSGRTSPADLL